LSRAELVPQGTALEVREEGGRWHIHVPAFAGHQMIAVS
jgi:hypothetical protein